jgi:hypothetical protein
VSVVGTAATAMGRTATAMGRKGDGRAADEGKEGERGENDFHVGLFLSGASPTRGALVGDQAREAKAEPPRSCGAGGIVVGRSLLQHWNDNTAPRMLEEKMPGPRLIGLYPYGMAIHPHSLWL